MKRIFGLMLLGLVSFSAVAGGIDDSVIRDTSSSVLRIKVALNSGGIGVGSGVVVAVNKVATNCHVLSGANAIEVVSGIDGYPVKVVQADWKHDVCILSLENLPLKPVKLGTTRTVEYDQKVYASGYPGMSPALFSLEGTITGRYALDSEVVIQASNPFSLGQSGGGLFNEKGELIGLTTLKSPGRNANYYSMSVEWVKSALFASPTLVENVSDAGTPFWASAEDKWPFFMKVVFLENTENWVALEELSKQWVEAEPTSTEAWYRLGTAESHRNEAVLAEQHMLKAVALAEDNSKARRAAAQMAEYSGKHMEAVNLRAKLASSDVVPDN